MLSRLWAGLAMAACAVIVVPASVAAEQAAPPPAQNNRQEPTEEEMAGSPEAQQHIAAAMTLAKSDLVEEAKAMCTATGPRRPNLVRQLAGLPPEPQAVIEPTEAVRQPLLLRV